MTAGKKLQQLLDYVAHYSSDLKKMPSALHEGMLCHEASSLMNIEGLEMMHESQWWFKLSRLEVIEPEYLVDVAKIVKKCAGSKSLYIDWSSWPENAKLTPVFLKKTHVLTCSRQSISFALKLYRQCQDYILDHSARQSKKLYDRLFAWYLKSSEGALENIELVAGFGMLKWILPSGIQHNYPLITLKVELNLDEHGSIYVGPADIKPQIELDALIAENEIQGVMILRASLQEALDDGHFLNLFERETFADLLQMVSVGLGSNAKVIQEADISEISTSPCIVDSALLFARPSKNGVLIDDIEALKQYLDEHPDDIPELPLSLVTDLNDFVRPKLNIAYRGLSCVEQGEKREELYFTLSSNKEQVSIIKQLDNSPGVVVQGPPGTGKTHTIANIICHYLANGKKILVTAQQPHVLKTLHEKIPDAIKHLVVSRIGNSQESKLHLERNIDHIIETLSHLNEPEVEAQISTLSLKVDRLHSELAEIDLLIANFVKRNTSMVHLDGLSYKLVELKAVVEKGENDHEWFIDMPFDGIAGDFPVSLISLETVKQAREQLSGLLPYYSEGNLENLDKLLSPKEYESLFLKFNNLAASRNYIDNSRIGLTQKFSIQMLNKYYASLQAWRSSIFQIYKTNEIAANFLKLIKMKGSIEKNLICELIEKNLDLTSCRKNMLINPVDVPLSARFDTGLYQAVCRGAQGKSPQPWYATNKNTSAILKQITVLGHTPSNQNDWQLVLQYLDLQNRVVELASRWNSIISTLNLPKMEGETRQQLAFFDMIASIKTDIDHHIRVHDNGIKVLLVDVFGEKNLNLDQVESLDDYMQYLKAHIDQEDLIPLRQMVDSHLKYLEGRQFFKSDRIMELLDILRKGTASGASVKEFSEISRTISLLQQNKHLFNSIKDCCDKLSASGAPNLAQRLLIEPCDDMYCELHQYDIFRAWHWARAKHYLASITDEYNSFESLESRRKFVEGQLALCYEQLAANKTWLAMKINASEKMLVSLNRYKIAVNKIGKGKGRNAERYRRDAQEALLTVSSSIPCWIMSHIQVSETMPAKLGMFDLIIIDEASQSSVEAIPVLLRAKKLLIVGDNKQVSPSNVGLSVDQINMFRNKYLVGQPHKQFLTPDMSLFDIGSAIYDSNVMLLEHFRCNPSIIKYSNNNFYGGRIKPMRISRASERFDPPMVAIYAEGGKRESKGNKHINPLEAELIIREMRQLFDHSFSANKTVGVISLLGAAQAEYIQTLALDAFGALKLAAIKFACGEPSSFQGAEKDIIFLSMVADPENCTPLSRLAHEQRLNVAASRAKERMYLVHSVRLDQLSLNDLRRALLTHFYAGKDNPGIEPADSISLCKTEFERKLFSILSDQGYNVLPSYQIGSYTVDFVVEYNDKRVIIECDGDNGDFDATDWAKQMSKQRDLERSGWEILRYFRSSWSMDVEAALMSITSDLESREILSHKIVLQN